MSPAKYYYRVFTDVLAHHLCEPSYTSYNSVVLTILTVPPDQCGSCVDVGLQLQSVLHLYIC
jgi:hypothetical protein